MTFNEPAFPIPATGLFASGAQGAPGMTVRDYFASAILPQVLIVHGKYIADNELLPGKGGHHYLAADVAYAYADAMLERRAK